MSETTPKPCPWCRRPDPQPMQTSFFCNGCKCHGPSVSELPLTTLPERRVQAWNDRDRLFDELAACLKNIVWQCREVADGPAIGNIRVIAGEMLAKIEKGKP